jgi:phosphotriesterase-related protein
LIDSYEKGVEELNLYRQRGGGTIVDAQPVMSGRVAEWEKQASEESGVNIVASTGFHKMIFYYDDRYVFHWDEQRIADLYISEVTEGMLSSRMDGNRRLTCRAGIIKVAVDSGGLYADATYEKLHTAAAAAQRETGAPVMCHIERGADPMEVVDFYVDKHGVPAERLWLAHTDRAKYDIPLHKDLLARGVYLEYDTIGRFKYHSDGHELALMRAMLDAGYEKRLLVGLDTTRARIKRYGAKIGLDYILETFIPFMKRHGVTEGQIANMTVDNPAEALSIEQNMLTRK